MDATLKDERSATDRLVAAWQRLPPRMRVLYIATSQRTGGWLADAFAADSASKVLLEEAVGTAAGLGRLRDQAFDAVLVSHESGELDALDLVEGYRAGGADEPIVVLGTQSEQEMAPLCYEIGADGYVCVHSTTIRNMIWVVARGIQRHQLVRDNQRFSRAEQTRLGRGRDEANRLVAQQRALLDDHQKPDTAAGEQPLNLPGQLIAHYCGLLRTYVIMGSGNLSDELERLAKLLVTTGLTAQQTMQLHLHALEELLHGLGTLSTRHVMTRADLLVIELMMHLAEGYRRRYQERVHPPLQRLLPGFE